MKQERPPVQPFLQPYFEKHPKMGCLFVIGMCLILGSYFASSDGGENKQPAQATHSYSADDTRRQAKASEQMNAKIGAEMNLKALLKDADSVKYRDVFLSRIEGGNLMLCGQVNSKNSFGGFTGYKRFIASPNPDAPTLIEGETSGLGAAVDRSFPQAYAAVCSNTVERF